jgi:maltose alpha-D-glucosyltransferase/alpha-amylase
VLPSWLTRRRWFASKDRPLKRVRLAALTTIPGAGFAFTEIEAELTDGTSGRYVLPIAISWGNDTTTTLHIQLALARVRRGRTIGHLTDAFSLPLFAHGVLRMLRERAAVPTVQQSVIRFEPTPRLDELDLGDAPDIRWLAAEQSNSSLIIADTLVLKLVRHLMSGIHPEAEMSRYLTQLGYPNTAPLYGEVVRVDPAGVPHTLAILQGYIDNQGNAWDWALDYLRRAVDELALAVDGGAETAPDIANEEDALQGYCTVVGTIGRRLGELHAALASPTDDPAFAPEPASPEHVRAWKADAKTMLITALDLLHKHVAGGTHTLDDDVLDLAHSLFTRREALLAAMEERVPANANALRVRIHGDFHLGQVLLAQGDAYLIDFEGEPARPLDYRRAKTCTLRDVAGLLRSLSYAGAAAQSSIENAPQQTADRKRTLFERFRVHAVEAFLAQYRAAAVDSPQPLVGATHEEPLLDLFLIEKAAYEICYEAANRPTWLALPVRGLAAIASRVLGATGAPPLDTEAGEDRG